MFSVTLLHPTCPLLEIVKVLLTSIVEDREEEAPARGRAGLAWESNPSQATSLTLPQNPVGKAGAVLESMFFEC